MAIHCNGKSIPFRVNFVYSQSETVEVTQVWDSEIIPYNADFITINENWNIGIQFFVEHEEDWDEEARIEISTSLFDKEDNQEVLTYKLERDNTNIQWIYRNKEDEFYPWRMATYLIDIFYKKQKYSTGFTVAPIHLRKEQIEQIHFFLQNKVEGLIYDYVYSNKSFSNINSNVLNIHWFYEYVRYMMDVQDKLSFALNRVEKNPVMKLVNSYELSQKPGRIGIKSINWDLKSSKQGMGLHFNKKKKNVYDTDENRWIKNIILSWKNDIKVASSLIKKNYQLYQENILELQHEKILLEVNLEKLQRKWNVSKTMILNLRSKIKIIEKECSEKERIIYQHKNWISCLETIESKMGFLLSESFFSEIERGYKKPLLKQNSYHILDELYQESRKIREDKGNKKRLIKIYKPTWLIFEYYCLFSTIDVLRELGYQLVDGIKPEMLELFYENKIPSGHKFILENDNSLIEVWYDKYHAHDENEAREKGELFFTHLSKKRPDIKMDVYKKSVNGDILFKDSLVIDAKFRKLQSIYNSDYVKDTYDQLLSYNSFFYCGSNRLYNNTRSSCVNRVLCLYANDDEQRVKKVVNPITFIKLFPKIAEDTIEEVGRAEMTEEIIEWLDDLIN